MSMYAIPMVRLNATGDEVEEAVVRRVLPPHGAGGHAFEMTIGRQMPAHEVANLIITGDEIHVATSNSDNLWSLGDRVRVRPGGPFERIESVDEDGRPTSTLLDLPKFT